MLEIDVDRMKHGPELEERFVGGPSHGYPWSIVLDAAGKVLATSDAPDGNIGFPASPAETEHFFGMLEKTRQRLTDAELATLRSLHAEFVKPILEANRQR